MPNLDLYIQVAGGDWAADDSFEATVRAAVEAALSQSPDRNAPIELSCRFSDDAESQQLNNSFRGQDKPTNVLSFAGVELAQLADVFIVAKAGGPPVILGDLLLAHGVIMDEAAAQNKDFDSHLSHLLVHGVLHLLGFDHQETDAAEAMEQLECDILADLGIKDPYNSDLVRQ